MLAVALALGFLAQDHEFTIAPMPDWVVPIDLEEASVFPVHQITGGAYHIHRDTQHRYTQGELSTFADVATYVHNSQGVPSASQVRISFDPEYESLTIHSVDVIRNGEASGRLDPDQIQIVQREEELQFQIYDGAKTALMFLPDVRSGDIVRYAYTIDGSNPAYAGHYVRSTHLAYHRPIHRIRHRLLWPVDAPLTIRTHGEVPTPETGIIDGAREYVWERRNVRPTELLNAEPSWYFVDPWIQFTTFQSWNELARTELNLLDPSTSVGSPLASEIERIRSAHRAPARRALAALRFVQEEVRYMGIELGVGAFEASLPNLVYERRFGDCKDKSLLLLTMLRELGIDAWAGLVGTGMQHTISDYAPSPALFNHVIVKIDLPGGPYWVDPTESSVGGDLSSYEPPAYGKALVIAESTDAPESISNSGQAGTSRVEYSIDAVKVGAPAQLSVTTHHEGRNANNFRSFYARTNPDQFSKECEEYNASFYDSAESAAEVEVFDDLESNVLRVRERYSLPDFWLEEEGGYSADIGALEILHGLPDLASGDSMHPAAISHPLRREVSISVQLSEAWSFDSSSKVIENDAFRFTFDVDAKNIPGVGVKLNLDYSFESKADFAEPGLLARVIEDADEARDDTIYSLSYSPSSPGDVAILLVPAQIAFALVGLLALALHLLSRRMAPARAMDPAVEPPTPEPSPALPEPHGEDSQAPETEERATAPGKSYKDVSLGQLLEEWEENLEEGERAQVFAELKDRGYRTNSLPAPAQAPDGQAGANGGHARSERHASREARRISAARIRSGSRVIFIWIGLSAALFAAGLSLGRHRPIASLSNLLVLLSLLLQMTFALGLRRRSRAAALLLVAYFILESAVLYLATNSSKGMTIRAIVLFLLLRAAKATFDDFRIRSEQGTK